MSEIDQKAVLLAMSEYFEWLVKTYDIKHPARVQFYKREYINRFFLSASKVKK